MVKASPAIMFPSKVIAGELPMLIVASAGTPDVAEPSMIQKMLSACTPDPKVNVITPFTVKAPGTWIMKIGAGLLPASKVRLIPVTVEMVPGDAITVSPEVFATKIWLARPVNVPVDVKPSAVLNAPLVPKTALYAAVTAVVSPAAHDGGQTKPVAVPGGNPVFVIVAPTLPVTTEVPVFDTVPPRSPKLLADPSVTESA